MAAVMQFARSSGSHTATAPNAEAVPHASSSSSSSSSSHPSSSFLFSSSALSSTTTTSSSGAAPPGFLRLSGACRCQMVRLSVTISKSTDWQVCHCPHCRRGHAAAWAVLLPVERNAIDFHIGNFRGGAGGAQVSTQSLGTASWRAPDQSNGTSNFNLPTRIRVGPESRCLGLGVAGEAVHRSFCSSCGSTILVLVFDQVKRKTRVYLCAGVLEDKKFPNGFIPDFREVFNSQRAPFYCAFNPSSGGPQAWGPPAPLPRRQAFTGMCSCGACRFSVKKLDGTMLHCHCGMCRQMSGAGFQTWTPIRSKDIVWISKTRLRKLRTSQHAQREVCSDCGGALTILYDSQRATTWMAAAVFDRGTFPEGVSAESSQHICTAYAPPWFPLRRWPPDGVERVRGVYAGDTVPLFEETNDGTNHDLLEMFGARDQNDLHDENSEDADVAEAIKRSLADADAVEPPHKTSRQGGFTASEKPIDPVAVQNLCEISGVGREVVVEILRRCNHNADEAAMQLLSAPSAAAAAAAAAPPLLQRTSQSAHQSSNFTASGSSKAEPRNFRCSSASSSSGPSRHSKISSDQTFPSAFSSSSLSASAPGGATTGIPGSSASTSSKLLPTTTKSTSPSPSLLPASLAASATAGRFNASSQAVQSGFTPAALAASRANANGPAVQSASPPQDGVIANPNTHRQAVQKASPPHVGDNNGSNNNTNNNNGDVATKIPAPAGVATASSKHRRRFWNLPAGTTSIINLLDD